MTAAAQRQDIRASKFVRIQRGQVLVLKVKDVSHMNATSPRPSVWSKSKNTKPLKANWYKYDHRLQISTKSQPKMPFCMTYKEKQKPFQSLNWSKNNFSCKYQNRQPCRSWENTGWSARVAESSWPTLNSFTTESKTNEWKLVRSEDLC